MEDKKVIVIPPDGVGSKGDEAMIRGVLNLFQGKRIELYTQRNELWKGWIIDRNGEFGESYRELRNIEDVIHEPVHLVIIGADIMDGLYGNEDTLMRLNIAEKVIENGGCVDVFSCSFRSNVNLDVLQKIVAIGKGIHFHLRDRNSLHNFESQTGLKADYFPDLAFLCEKYATDRTEKVCAVLKEWKDANKDIIAVNFSEHSFKGFYKELNDTNRKRYVTDAVDAILKTAPEAAVVLISHDTRRWPGHYEDHWYSKAAGEYLRKTAPESKVLVLDEFLTEAELLEVLSYIDVIVSGRMHLAIAGIRNVVIPIGYMGMSKDSSFVNIEKFRGMYKERIGRDDLVVSSCEELTVLLKDVLSKKDDLKKNIAIRNKEQSDSNAVLINQYRAQIGLPDCVLHENEICVKHSLNEEILRDYIAQKERMIKDNTFLYWQEKDSILEEKANVVKDYQAMLEEKEKMLTEERGKVEEQYNQLQEKLNIIREKESVIQEKELTIQEKESVIQEKEQIIRNKEGHIELLLQAERDFVNVKNSKCGRIMYAWWGLKEKLIPLGSKRRLVVSIIKKFITHPVYMLKKCTPGRVARTLHYMRTEDAGMVAERLEAATIDAGEDIERIPLDLEPVVENKSSIAEYEKIVLPKVDKPLVSIIIPVYNQFHYTYNCLKSIAKHTDGIACEVILADDCSTDLTASITDVVENIIVVRTPENMRFLLNCNHAAKQARGEYIFFLNNDTQVLENWLSSLLELIENDETIGMTGSKLLYPDGALQEAGGIIWNDASAWNLGNQHGPKEPEFNYVKEADYISGAAILIRHSLWKEIGGFDERFVPAYYEDTDLAMEVRAHGYKVVYQPLSMVVHFEGISNGTDTSSGQKEYQIVNQKKFYDKWKNVLKKEHFPNGENVFLAKDRSRFKKHILVVDHYVPKHDKDAGGKCTYMYLKMFVKMGMKVTFIGDNFYPEQPYTQELNQLGIEVLYGNYYYKNWKKWLKENAHYFDYIYLQRPHISIKYIDIVKEYSDAKILYFAHDLHHIREYREYELSGDEEKLKSSQKWKKIEYELFEKTDVGHVVGSYEQQIMQKAFPDKPVRNIPLYIYEGQPENLNKDFSTREDIMYVGGFGHPPNIDAVLWFGKEVFPKILEKYPMMKWYVIGSKVPAEIQALASDNIIITGFLPDEELDKLYRKCRMSVVPLRVGAGVKGKVVEAAYYQIPLVTTSIGGEGLDTAVGNMVLEDDADQMASVICDLYEDYTRLKDMSDAGREFIEKYFTEQEAERVLREDISI